MTIAKNIWKDYLVVRTHENADNFAEVVAHSMKQEGYADKDGNILINDKTADFIRIYKTFFVEKFLDLIIIKVTTQDDPNYTTLTGTFSFGV